MPGRSNFKNRATTGISGVQRCTRVNQDANLIKAHVKIKIVQKFVKHCGRTIKTRSRRHHRNRRGGLADGRLWIHRWIGGRPDRCVKQFENVHVITSRNRELKHRPTFGIQRVNIRT